MQFGENSGIWKGAFTVNIGNVWGSNSYFGFEFTGAEDVADIYASQFRGEGCETYERIDSPMDWGESWHVLQGPNPPLRCDKILVDGKFIGVSAGRINDYYHKKVISLGFIDKEHAIEGKDVMVIWGTPGKPQKEVHAKVARFPYYNGEFRNETFDVEKIPHPQF